MIIKPKNKLIGNRYFIKITSLKAEIAKYFEVLKITCLCVFKKQNLKFLIQK